MTKKTKKIKKKNKKQKKQKTARATKKTRQSTKKKVSKKTPSRKTTKRAKAKKKTTRKTSLAQTKKGKKSKKSSATALVPSIESSPISSSENEVIVLPAGPSDEGETKTDSSSLKKEKNLELSGRAISPSDPLRRYMEEVQRHPLLDREEELELARRMREEGDIDAAKQLVSANLRLVVKIAYEYRSMYTNLLDLIQEGNIGLMKAVSKFDPTKGARVGYYASWWIRSYMLKYLLDNFRLVRVGTTQAQKKLFYHLMREKQRLEAQGIEAAPKLLADKLHVKEKEVIEMGQRLSSHGAELSIDTPVQGSEEKVFYRDLFTDESISADESLVKKELLKILREKLPEFQETLNQKERQVLKERLLSEEPKTLQQVADDYGLTRERVRQIEAKVIQKIREFLSEYLEDPTGNPSRSI